MLYSYMKVHLSIMLKNIFASDRILAANNRTVQ